MKNIFITITLSFVILSTFGQVERKTEPANTKISRYLDQKMEKASPQASLPNSNIEQPQRVSIMSDEDVKTYATPIKATKMGDAKVKKNVSINIDPNKSDLDNLLTLIEEKENIHKNNNSLTKSNDYKLLLSKISSFKNKFNDSVRNKGIENCSTKEQNYFLSFLKEEGKEEEYKTSILKIK